MVLNLTDYDLCKTEETEGEQRQSRIAPILAHVLMKLYTPRVYKPERINGWGGKGFPEGNDQGLMQSHIRGCGQGQNSQEPVLEELVVPSELCHHTSVTNLEKYLILLVMVPSI